MIETFSELPVLNDALFLTHWQPEDQPPKGVMVIAHGMAEHAARYKEFAESLTRIGFTTYAGDHRGHGRSVNQGSPLGHFADENGWTLAVSDLNTVVTHAAGENPDLPVFLFGHSMGSFLVRDLITSVTTRLAGAIISGTANTPGIIGTACHLLASAETSLRGPQAASPFMDNLSFGAFNLFFQPTRTRSDWLCSNPESVDRYLEDPLCGYVSTTAFFRDMGWGLMRISRAAHLKKTPDELPLLFLAGDKDPVASFGFAVTDLTRRYRKAGSTDITSHLYEGARHELFGEWKKDDVYRDIQSWIDKVMP